MVGVGTRGGSVAEERLDTTGRLSSRTGGTGGSRWARAGLLLEFESKSLSSCRWSDFYLWIDSAEVADRGLAAPAFSRPTFKSIFPMAVFKMAAACSCEAVRKSFPFTVRI